MNTISKTDFRKYIEKFDFITLFNLLGWNYIDEMFPVKAKEETYIFHSVAEKGGFRIIVFKPDQVHDMPDYTTRLQLDRKIGQLYREHLLIFCDRNNTRQIWQIFVRQLGKPSRLSETKWVKGQEPELLYQKTSNLFFTLDEEDHITIADVVDRVADNFVKNIEQVTKKFYENFRKEHKRFIEFITGIASVTDREWYASLMLNRLMFCYFIQKKGFLDNNRNYFKEKLHYCQQQKGKDQFYVSFYKNFLIALFHEGLNSPDQSEDLKKEIGRIPYLNGGLFDVHELEIQYNNIDINDEAFEKIFQFFDQYNWHLDNRASATGKDIDPDVIGYIFEKYINDRAQMGAYYTKEDITDYIGRSCIIPFLFEETSRKYPKAFKPGSEIWQMLKESGDTYIYPAVKHGISIDIRFMEMEPAYLLEYPIPLPSEIEIGIDTNVFGLIERRKEWNKPAPAEVALPTEIWREIVDRRNHYREVRSKIESGEINSINEFITYNLNIRQFAQDVIDTTNDPDFLRHFYDTLSKVTILDPTCGSGAFLFAAMNILEPLYEGCLQRMENFVSEVPKGRLHRFEEVLAMVNVPEHPNLQYFVFKSIILRNLYGVDIMKEAVEIAKLRLFLKLVATVEADHTKPNLGLEPLPDIDFNIRPGNTLVGYATKKEIEDMQGLFVTQKMKEQILDECDLVARAFQRFKELQIKGYNDKIEFTNAKKGLIERLNTLENKLNEILHKQYYEGSNYKKWVESHQPFHWFAEFYEIIHDKGGFDVVIGNPPYVELKDLNTYVLKDYKTLKCGNLYAICYERAIQLGSRITYIGLIIPVASVCTDGYSELQKLWIESGSLFISCYNDRPGKLFEGLEHIRLAIVCVKIQRVDNKIFASKYYKWNTIAREHLFQIIGYNDVTTLKANTLIPKVNNYNSISILEKLQANRKSTSSFLIKMSNHKVYFTRKLSGFVQILNFIPKIIDELGNLRNPSELKELKFLSEVQSSTYLAVLNSSLFYWYLTVWSDCRNLNQRELQNFNFDFTSANYETIIKLKSLSSRIMDDFQTHSQMLPMNFKNVGKLNIQCIYPKFSKSIIDEIDTILAEHYGFTPRELDFIINYDIKYRMGKELENGEEE